MENDISCTETPPPTLEVVDSSSGAYRAMLSTTTSGKDDKKGKTMLQRGFQRILFFSHFLNNNIIFSFTSNGWFRFLMDGEVSTMFNNGVTDTFSEETRIYAKKAFMTRWRHAKQPWNDDSMSVSVLCVPSVNKKVEVPNWELWSARSTELTIKCIKGEGQIIIKDELGGFIVETNDKMKHSQMPESALPPDFHTGWCAHGMTARRAKFRCEIQRRRVQELAWELWNSHLKEARAKPREALIELQNAAACIQDAVTTANLISGLSMKTKHVKQPRIEKVQELLSALKCVRDSVMDDRRLSTFEFSVSGVVSALHNLLSLVERQPQSYPARIFGEAFSHGIALSSLALKMVAVLESSEKFPQYLYDTPGGSAFGLQLLSRRLRMRLEHAGPEQEENRQLLNRTGRLLKSEPLTTVGRLKAFLLKMVAKQWLVNSVLGSFIFSFAYIPFLWFIKYLEVVAKCYGFVKAVEDAKKSGESLKFTYISDFDEHGIIYWLGTNGRCTSEWTNPASIISFNSYYDYAIISITPLYRNANFTIDLGVVIYPTAYTLRHARGYGRSSLRNWLLQGSKDKQVWEVLVAHSDDTSLGDPGSTATWPIEDDRSKGPFRYLRIAQNGKNSSGQTYYLSLSGFEVYGEVVDVIVDGFLSVKDEQDKVRNLILKKLTISYIDLYNIYKVFFKNYEWSVTVIPLLVLILVVCALCVVPTGHGMIKIVVARARLWDALKMILTKFKFTKYLGWVDVLWDNGQTNSYRFGADGRFDIQRVVGSSGTSSSSMVTSTVSPSPSSVLEAVRAKGRGFMKTRDSPSPFASFAGFAPFAGKPRKSGATTPLSRFAKVPLTSSSSGAPTNGTNIGKKSMSTTNLVEERPKPGPSVASTGQAASAESLQHQTPSLEDLLARANTHAFGRIAESLECSTETPEPGRDTPVAIEADESDSATSADSRAELSVCSSQSSVIDTTPREEDEEQDDEDEEEEESVEKGDFADMADALSNSSERSLFEKLREVFGTGMYVCLATFYFCYLNYSFF
uniref:E3 ubiquitin-protein ligase n=1 Tax=Heterorhabditis bacteriophora TaxID=37862 RepID=A0A1I7WSM5_HETBA